MMRINKFAAAVMLAASALGLSACATGFPAKVSRFQAMPAPQGQSFVVVPLDARNIGGLEFSRYAEMVAQAMQAQGYARAASIEQASMVVRVGYGVDQGRTEYVRDPFSYGSRYNGFGYGGYGGYGGFGYGGYGRPYYSLRILWRALAILPLICRVEIRRSDQGGVALKRAGLSVADLVRTVRSVKPRVSAISASE